MKSNYDTALLPAIFEELKMSPKAQAHFPADDKHVWENLESTLDEYTPPVKLADLIARVLEKRKPVKRPAEGVRPSKVRDAWSAVLVDSGEGPAERLKAWRMSKGFNQTQSAIELDVMANQVSAYERGATVPSLRIAFRIEDVTGIPARAWLAK